MSRYFPVKSPATDSFPRVSGDEPYIAGRLLDYSKFSPRERG